MTADRECIVWCPSCKEIKGEVQRIPTGQEGVYTHKSIPDPMPKKCDCGCVLERKQ